MYYKIRNDVLFRKYQGHGYINIGVQGVQTR